jgi:GNAT superfamily N-acetyltransferase
VAGGLIGYTAWGWLYIEQLWVAEARRGTGLGGRLIAAAEQEAVRRGCRNAWIDTFNPDALRLYERLDYQVFGILEGFPPGHTRSFLRKRLATGDGSPSPDRVRSDGYCGTATPLKR